MSAVCPSTSRITEPVNFFVIDCKLAFAKCRTENFTSPSKELRMNNGVLTNPPEGSTYVLLLQGELVNHAMYFKHCRLW